MTSGQASWTADDLGRVAKWPGSFDERPVAVDKPGKQPQVHELAVACGREADNLADGGRFFVLGGHEGAWLDLAGVAGFA